MTRRDMALWVWERQLGLPYLWGGNDPLGGWDCSGFVLEGLKACGLFPRDADDTAAGLARKYPATATLRPGVLLFWGDPITHVEVVWQMDGAQPITLGASGGGRATTDLAEARRRDAYVKVRPARPGWTFAVDPFWE